jgi:hypothetical protein
VTSIVFKRKRKKGQGGGPIILYGGKNKHKCKLLLEGVVGASSKKGF